MNVVPIRPKKVYVAFDLILKLRNTKARAGDQGPEASTTERRRTIGVNETDYSIFPGVEHRHIVETCSM